MPPATTTCQDLADKAWNAQYSSPRDSHAWASEALAEAEQCDDAACEAVAHRTITIAGGTATADDAAPSSTARTTAGRAS